MNGRITLAAVAVAAAAVGPAGMVAAGTAAAGPAAPAVQMITVGTKTGDTVGASAPDGAVAVKVHGSAATTGWLTLDNSADNFTRNGTDLFTFTVAPLGQLQSVEVKYNPASSGDNWYLDYVTVNEGPLNVWFPSYRWFFDPQTSSLPRAVGTETVIIQTMTGAAAGNHALDASVSVRVHGSRRSTGWLLLDNGSANFTPNKTDQFTFILSDLGHLQSVDVRFDSPFSDDFWLLNQVTATEGQLNVFFPALELFTDPETRTYQRA